MSGLVADGTSGEVGQTAPIRRGSGRNALWMMVERVSHLGVAFLVTIVVARELGPADYGTIALGLAFFALLQPINTLTAQCLMRDTMAEPRSANMLMNSASIAAGLVTSTIVACLAVGLVFTYGLTSTEGVVVMVIAGSALLRPLQVVDAWFIMNQDSRRVVIIRVTVLFVLAAFRISLPLLGYGVVAVAWTYMIEAFLASVGSYIAYRRWNKDYQWVVSRARVASVAREFVPLLLMSSTALIYQRLGQVMLAWLSDLDQVGIYAASASLVDAPKFPLIALAVSATPRLLALKQTDPVRFREALQDFARFVNLFGYAVTIGLVLVFAPLAPLILGKAYADATVVIIILGVSTPLIALGACLQLLTNWEKLYRQAVIRNLTGALISIALNFALMPRYGAVGGAISTFCALLWVYVIGVALDKKTRFIFDITLPTLEPIGATKVLLARRRTRKEEQALLKEMNDFYSA